MRIFPTTHRFSKGIFTITTYQWIESIKVCIEQTSSSSPASSSSSSSSNYVLSIWKIRNVRFSYHFQRISIWNNDSRLLNHTHTWPHNFAFFWFTLPILLYDPHSFRWQFFVHPLLGLHTILNMIVAYAFWFLESKNLWQITIWKKSVWRM